MRFVCAALAALLALQPALLYADGVGQIQGQITQAHGAPVLVQNPTNGQVLTFNGSTWVAAAPAGGGESLAQTLAIGADANSVPITGLKTIAYAAGNGAVTHITGPSDQEFKISSGSGRELHLLGSDAVVFHTDSATELARINNTGDMQWSTGLGAITHLKGPTDQAFTIQAAASRSLSFGGGAASQWTIASTGATTVTPGASAGDGLTLNTSGTGHGMILTQTGTGGFGGRFIKSASSAYGALSAAVSNNSGGSVIELTAGSQTTSTPIIDAYATWNAGGTTFRGVELSITETGDAAASTYFRILGGASATTHEFSILKGGITCTTGNYQGTTGTLFGCTASATDPTAALDTNLNRSSAGVFDFGTSSANTSGSWRSTAGTLTTLNGTSGQTLTIQATGSNHIQFTGGNASFLMNATSVSNWATSTPRSSSFPGEVLDVIDLTTMAQNQGAGIGLSGRVDGSGNAFICGIQGFKENGTNGNYLAGVRIYVNSNSGAQTGSTEAIRWTSGADTRVPSGKVYGFSAATDNTSAADVALSRGGAASTAALGNGTALDDTGTLQVATVTRATATTGTALTVKGGAPTAGGTDKSAGGLALSSGLSTGTGTANVTVQTGYALASGSTGQTAYDRLVITSKSVALSTSTNTATTFCVMANATSNSGVGATVHFIIEVADGSNHVSTITGVATYSASNRAGTVTATANTAGTGNLAVSDVTTFTALTTTWETSVSGTNVNLRVKPTWSAGTPTSVKMTYSVVASGQTTLTPQ